MNCKLNNELNITRLLNYKVITDNLKRKVSQKNLKIIITRAMTNDVKNHTQLKRLGIFY